MGKTGRRTGAGCKERRKKDVLERCVLCGRLTPVKRDSHIAGRRYYVEGAGQLCGRCFYDVYQTGQEDRYA